MRCAQCSAWHAESAPQSQLQTSLVSSFDAFTSAFGVKIPRFEATSDL